MQDDEFGERISAHRAALAAIAMVLNERCPGAFADIIEAVSAFEGIARQRNATTAMIDELRHLREDLEAMRGDLPEGRPQPPADSGMS